MRFHWMLITSLVIAGLVALGGSPRSAAAHAALVRSDPAAGAHLDTAPNEIRMWFAEPLEPSYSGAYLLDAAGNPVPGATVATAPPDNQEMIITPPPHLPDGPYTVAWHTLSAADGHTMSSYFSFRVGAGTASGFVPTAGGEGNETARALTRWLAILGLAALLAIAPVSLAVLDPSARSLPACGVALGVTLRRYALVAAALALVTSVAALAAQAAAISPGSGIVAAMGQTLSQTRYGQFWLLRLLLLLLGIATVLAALWARPSWRYRLLLAAAVLGLALPVPFSLLSHAAAESRGSGAAIAADALHLLAASIWGGGLLLLAVVLLPALRRLSSEERRAALRVAIPRFSIVGVAAWAVLALSGLYAAWLHVGTLEAMRETPYGQTLLIKGALLLPILALAAFHLVLGWRGIAGDDPPRLARTITVEALLVVAVFLIVGRLIGLEPARDVLASEQPTQLVIPLSFETEDGPRQARLAVAPGAAGINTFTIEVGGGALPDGSVGVLRFALPAHDMGEKELQLPQAGTNRFTVEGPELALAGDWQIEALVRKIGAFSWQTQTALRVGDTPPAAPEPNPAPLFGVGGIAGMVALSIGLVGLSAAALTLGAPTRRRRGVGGIGVAAIVIGAVLLAGSRLPNVETTPALAGGTTTMASPAAASPSAMADHGHMMPMPATATPVRAPGVGTPVSQDGLMVTITATPTHPGPVTVTVEVHNRDGSPVSHAHVMLFAEMTGMGKPGAGFSAVEAAPGRYVAHDVPLTMAGDWRLTARVSPLGQETVIFPVAITVS